LAAGVSFFSPHETHEAENEEFYSIRKRMKPVKCEILVKQVKTACGMRILQAKQEYLEKNSGKRR
jgi:hypothetical protein